MSRFKFSLICLLLILIFCQCSTTTKLQSIAQNALLEKYDYMKKDDLSIQKIKMPFCSELKVFNIIYLGEEEPSPSFLVVIDNKKDAHVFLGDPKINEINELLSDNIKKHITKNNLPDFINMFLILFDRSRSISSYDDFDYLRDLLIKHKDEIGSVSPMKYEISENEITADFFSWSELSLKKWNITLSDKGQIMSYSYKNLFVLGMAPKGEKWEIGGAPVTEKLMGAGFDIQ